MTLTVLLTLICPGLGLIVGYYCLTNDDFDWRSAAICFSLFIGAIAYSLNITNGDDLVRYFDFVERVSNVSLGKAMTMNMKGEGNLWLFSLICWLIGKTGNYHLLPALSTFVVYYIGFYITGKIGEDIRIKKEYISLYYGFILIASNFWGIANNVRNIFSFSVIGYAIFRDIYEKKRNLLTWTLYILPIYIHPSAIVIILLRFIIIFTGRFKILGILGCIFMNPLVEVVYNYTQKINGATGIVLLIQTASKKAYEYFNDTGSLWGIAAKNSGSRRLSKFLYISIAIIMCILAYRCTIYLREKIKDRIEDAENSQLIKINRMIEFTFYIGLLTISCIPMLTPEYWRFSALLILFGAPVYFIQKIIENDSMIERGNVIYFGSAMLSQVMYIAMLACLFLWIRSVIQGANIQQLLTQPFLCSPFTMFILTILGKIIG